MTVPTWEAKAREVISRVEAARRDAFPGEARPGLAEEAWLALPEFRAEVFTVSGVLARLAGYDAEAPAVFALDMPLMSKAVTDALEPRNGLWRVGHLFRPEAFDAVAESAGLSVRFPVYHEFPPAREGALYWVRRFGSVYPSEHPKFSAPAPPRAWSLRP